MPSLLTLTGGKTRNFADGNRSVDSASFDLILKNEMLNFGERLTFDF